MFARWIGLFLSLLFISTAHAIPDIQHWQTENGIGIYFVEAHELPMVDLQIIFDAGSSRDSGKPGLALLTNSLLAEGAAGMTADEISRNFENLGAIYAYDASNDYASVSLRSVSDPGKLKPALENFKRVLMQPDFPQDSFERQRNRTMIAIRQKLQSPGDLARDAFYAAVFGEHPYAVPVEGTEESLQQISTKDVVSFHQQFYVASNAIIAIVGDLDRARVENLVNDLTEGLARGEKAPPIPEVSALTTAKSISVDFPSTQTHILVGQPGIKRVDPDYFPLYVGNHVLGGGGMVSQLFEEIREKRGLSYSAYSYFLPMREPGPFFAGLQTRTDQAKEALQLLNEQLHSYVENGPTVEELDAAKKNITGGFPLRIDSNRDIVSYLALIGFYGLPLNYLETFNEKVESVTVEQIRDAFKRRLSPDKLVVVMVGPEKTDTGENN